MQKIVACKRKLIIILNTMIVRDEKWDPKLYRWPDDRVYLALGPRAAHRAVDRVKRALGERGPVWWKDGALDSIARSRNGWVEGVELNFFGAVLSDVPPCRRAFG